METTPYKPGAMRAVMRLLRGQPTLSLQKDRDGQIYVSDGRRSLAIVAAGRAGRYRLGISDRIKALMESYDVPAIPLFAGDVVVNFGANIGELAVGLTESRCKVIAIEPDPVALACLRINVPDAEIIQTGLWKEDGDLTFYHKPDSADTTAIDKVGPPITVKAKRLDTLLEDRPGRIRLLIGDAEGAEPEVLLGAIGVLPRIDYVCLQCGPERHGEPTVEACSAILRESGFDILASPPKIVVARNRSLVTHKPG